MVNNEKQGFFATVLTAGMLLTIWGKMRSGKSNLAASIIERAVDVGYYVYTNIPFFRYEQIEEAIKEGYLLAGIKYRRLPVEVKTTRTCSELLRGLFATRKNLTVLDEAALFAASSLATSKKVRWLKALIFTIGKLDSSVVMIAQDKGSVIPAIRSSLVSYEIRVIKSSATNRRAEISVMPQELTEAELEPIHIDTWRNLQPTRLSFDSRAPTKFEFDIDIEEFFNKIANFNSLDAIKEAPRILDEMLQQLTIKKKEKGKSKKEIIKEIIQEFPDSTNEDVMFKLKEMGTSCTNTYVDIVRREQGVYG